MAEEEKKPEYEPKHAKPSEDDKDTEQIPIVKPWEK